MSATPKPKLLLGAGLVSTERKKAAVAATGVAVGEEPMEEPVDSGLDGTVEFDNTGEGAAVDAKIGVGWVESKKGVGGVTAKGTPDACTVERGVGTVELEKTGEANSPIS